MKIVIIGSGNVAYHLSKAFSQNGSPISQLFGRNEEDLKGISNESNISYSTTNLEEADFYIIAVNDDSIAEVSQLITKENTLVAHTSGSLPLEVLRGNYRKASFYPLQTFSKTKDLVYSDIPFFLEAENEADFNLMKNVADKISSKVLKSDFEQRKYIHLTAVFACNFTNHLFAKAKEISDLREIPFDYFFPLIKETVDKIYKIEPKLAQTGPAFRGDQKILESHEKLINDKDAKIIYKTINNSIKDMYKDEL